MSVEILSRIQFAFTVSFHYIYPPLSIGLGLLMVLFEGQYLRTGKEVFHRLARFWTKIFALTFGIGVATGIVMEFEFGTNWAAYSRFVGDIFGSALAAEGLFAFALESGFLGILLFGWNRVSKTMHFISTLGVWFGSMFSAVWIVVANSWQQTPAGYHLVGDGLNVRAEVTDFWAMVFNPSSVDRLTHTWIGAFLAGGFLVVSVHAYYLLKGKHVDISKTALKVAVPFVALVSLMQLVTGHHSADGVAENQPAKLAALEGHFTESGPADMYIMGWVNQEKQEVSGIKIPGGLSFLLEYDFEHPVTGLNAFPEEDRPGQVNAVFQFYHLMVAIGMALIGIGLLGVFLLWRGKLWESKWFLRILVLSVFLPQLANQFGWFAAEMGRQPWVVYGLLRTSEAFSLAVSQQQLVFSLILFAVIYSLLFALFIYLLNKKIVHGPDQGPMIDQRPKQQGSVNLYQKA